MKYLVRWQINGDMTVDAEDENAASDKAVEVIQADVDQGFSRIQEGCVAKVELPDILSCVVVDWGNK